QLALRSGECHLYRRRTAAVNPAPTWQYLARRRRRGRPGPRKPGARAARPPGRPRAITKYGFYRNKRELTTAAFQACACRWAPDQYDSAVLRIRARDAAGSSDASESI